MEEDGNTTDEMEGEPRNLNELKILLGYFKRNPKEFGLEDMKQLKKLFMSWKENGQDITKEEFEVYRNLMEARDAIRGTSDTEEETSEEEDSEETSDDTSYDATTSEESEVDPNEVVDEVDATESEKDCKEEASDEEKLIKDDNTPRDIVIRSTKFLDTIK